MAENVSYRYNSTIRILHWIMALMLIGMIISGYIMVKLDPDKSLYKWTIYDVHKSLGLSFFILTIIRIIVRLNSYIPPYRYEFSKFVRLLSYIVQKGFYIFFLLIPISGYLSSSLAGYDVMWFGYKLPTIIDVNKNLASKAHYIHSVLPYLSIVFILMHILGVIKHRYFDKKDVLERIL